MTEKLYYKDAYMKDFTAKVVAVSESCGKYLTELDRTAFFPNEGGQYADKGNIDGFKVYDVIENDGVIYHLLEEKLQIGKTVSCRIDFDDRYDKMQNHTGEHIVSGIIHKLFGLDNVGFHLGGEDVTLDINAPLKRDDLERVELLANEVVYEKTFTQATQLQPQTKIYEETIDINCSDPCRIIVSNVSTKTESEGYDMATFNYMKIISAYYSEYKAE